VHGILAAAHAGRLLYIAFHGFPRSGPGTPQRTIELSTYQGS
jgi:hypothetical protein